MVYVGDVRDVYDCVMLRPIPYSLYTVFCLEMNRFCYLLLFTFV
jgi:hypothetical protein